MTIKSRLIGFGIAFLLTTVFILAFIEYTRLKAQKIQHASNKVWDIKHSILQLRRNEKDFLARKGLKYNEKFQTEITNLKSHITNLGENTHAIGLNLEEIPFLDSHISSYEEKFNDIVKVQTKIGLTPKTGLYGQLRNAVHNAESQIKAINNAPLLAGMLQLRRNEKDFMLRLDLKYQNKFENNFDKLVLAIEQLDDIETRDNLLNSMRQYRKDFLTLIKNQTVIGLDHKSGLLGQLRQTIHETDTSLVNLQNNFTQLAQDESKFWRNVTWVIVISIITIVSSLLFLTIKAISKRLLQLKESFEDIANGSGDLTHKLDEKGNDEIAVLSQLFNTFTTKLHGIVSNIANIAKELSKNTNSSSSICSTTQEQVNFQRTETEQIISSITEMSSSINEISTNVHQAAEATQNVQTQSNDGRQLSADSSKAMQRLSKELETASTTVGTLENQSNEIGSVLSVINDIAEQTNLLALNAAIEAARAGESGRGFAVVADEVRNLAQRTRQSTEEINVIIEKLQSSVINTVTAMQTGMEMTIDGVNKVNQMTESLDGIDQAIQHISDMNNHIASAIEEQSAVSQNIQHNTNEITDTLEKTTQNMSDNLQMCQASSQLSQQLNNQISQFKL